MKIIYKPSHKQPKYQNDLTIEAFIQSDILPFVKRHQMVGGWSNNQKQAIINPNSKILKNVAILTNELQDQKYTDLYFKDCIFKKVNGDDFEIEVQLNGCLNNCTFNHCFISDLKNFKLKNCTFVNCNFARLYEVDLSNSIFENCLFVTTNNEPCTRNLNFTDCKFEACLIDRIKGACFDNVDFSKTGAALGLLYNYNEKLHYDFGKDLERFPIGYSHILHPNENNSFSNYSFRGTKINSKDFKVLSNIWAHYNFRSSIAKIAVDIGDEIMQISELPLPLLGPLTQGNINASSKDFEAIYPTFEIEFTEKTRDFTVVDSKNDNKNSNGNYDKGFVK